MNFNRIYTHLEEQYTLRFSWGEKDPYWIDFEAFEIISTSDDGPVWPLKDDSCQTPTDNINEAGSFVKGFIKWDGCMELHDLNFHFCGYSTLLENLMKDIYQQAKSIMGQTMNDDLSNLNSIK